MPRATVQGCGSPEGYCLRHYLLSLGFEIVCGPGEGDVAVLLGDSVDCSPLERARVVVADRLAAERCGGEPGRLARSLEPPDSVRVSGWRLIVFHGPESMFLVLRELGRLLEKNSLLYRTPPLTRDEVLASKP